MPSVPAVRFAILLLASAPLATGAGAATFQYDNVVYDWPDEGRRVVQDGWVRLTLDGDAPFAIRIFRSEQRPRDPAAWLERRMDFVVEDDETVDFRVPMDSLDLGAIPVTAGGQSVDGDMQLFMAMQVGDRIELVMLDYWGDNPADAVAALVEREVVPLMLSMRFVSEGAPPLLEPASPGPLDGVFYANTMGYGLNGIELQHHFLMLSADGYFFEDVPAGAGTAGFDFGAALSGRPDDAGTYRVAGDAIRFAYADGSVATMALSSGDGGLSIGERDYLALDPVPDGLVLEGSYSRQSFAQFGVGSGVSGGAYSGSYYSFGADGRFTADRSSGAFGSFENAAGDSQGGFAVRPQSDSAVGTYVVAGGALILTDTRGRVTVHSLAVVADGMIAIDGGIYLRPDD
ncbi:MAG: hypothetical protein R3F55_12750 [Alphaproteobacteria bacterium]